MLKKLPSLLQNLVARVLLQLQKLKPFLASLNLKQKFQSSSQDSNFSSSDSLSFNVSDSSEDSSEIKFYKFGVTLISVVFILSFFVNVVLNSQLDTLSKELNTHIIKADTTKTLEQDYMSVVKSLGVYKTVKGSKASIYPKTQLIYTDLPDGITLTKLKITEKTFEISLSGADALLFSQFLATISRNPLVATTILETASLNSGTDEYIVSIRGAFK